MASRSPVGWGLIGASTIAKQWVIDAIRAQPDHDVAAVLSTSADRGAQYATDHAIPRSYTDLDAFLGDADVTCVYISTTNEKHKDQCIAAARAGKHVLCEKPLALTLADALEMAAACEQAGVVMGTNHHLRNAVTLRAMRDCVAAGEIGDLISIQVFHGVDLPAPLHGWRLGAAETGGGVVPDITVHDADCVRFITGEDPTEVIAYSYNTGLGNATDDTAMAMMRLPGGALVHTYESFALKYAKTGIIVHGTAGSIYGWDIMTQRPVGQVSVTTQAGTRTLDLQHENLYAHALRAFADAINGQGRPAATAVDGIKSLAVALAVQASIDSGRSVTVDYGAA